MLVRAVLYRVTDESDILLILIGTVLLIAGISFVLGITVLYVSVITGAVIVNTRLRRTDLYPLVATIEHPLFLILLILAGAMWDPTDFIALFVAAILSVIRFVGKWAGLWIGSKKYPELKTSDRLAYGLITPGGMAIVMVMNFALFPERFPSAQFVFDVMVWAVLILNPLGMYFTLTKFPRIRS